MIHKLFLNRKPFLFLFVIMGKNIFPPPPQKNSMMNAFFAMFLLYVIFF